ncbi:MAG: PEP-CTERM sorting domain-containing protein [bacterium]|nr:PEP-CTERM sorting domain-containing protein [bacterium]
MSRYVWGALAVVAIAMPAQAAVTVAQIDFEYPTYFAGTGPLGAGPYVSVVGQDGWSRIAGADTNGVMAMVATGDNGPSLAGQQHLALINWAEEVRLERPILDPVASGDVLVTYQYDLKFPWNALQMPNPEPEWSSSNFRMRMYDNGPGVAPIGNHHFDGGGGPASTFWASSTPDGLSGGWSGAGDGGPAWLDRDWHTISWTLNYASRRLVDVTWDGAPNPHTGWFFYDWNGDGTGLSDSADLLRMWLQTYDNNDYVQVDNIIITADVPEPATLSLLALGSLAVLRRRR